LLLEEVQAGFCAVGVHRQVSALGLKLLLQVGQAQQAPCTGEQDGLELDILQGGCIVWHSQLQELSWRLLLLMLLGRLPGAGIVHHWCCWAVEQYVTPLMLQ
jgi:hypothetical protein